MDIHSGWPQLDMCVKDREATATQSQLRLFWPYIMYQVARLGVPTRAVLDCIPVWVDSRGGRTRNLDHKCELCETHADLERIGMTSPMVHRRIGTFASPSPASMLAPVAPVLASVPAPIAVRGVLVVGLGLLRGGRSLCRTAICTAFIIPTARLWRVDGATRICHVGGLTARDVKSCGNEAVV